MHSSEVQQKEKYVSHEVSEKIRKQILVFSKDFKRSWLSLGQHLHAVWQDKLFRDWGYDKFEHYTEREVGLKKQVCLRLLKTYLFLEEEEPTYLKDEFPESRAADKVPGFDEVNLLRLAKQKKELLKSDYDKFRGDIFVKGKNASVVRKDLAALIKERQQLDPEEERDKRLTDSIKKLINSLRVFQRDMNALKLISQTVVDDSEELVTKLEEELP